MPGTTDIDEDRSTTARISREIVQLHAEHYGRGPSKARTIWDGDVVVCILEEIFTPGEETLLRAGRFEEIRQNRQAFQDAIEPLLVEVVEDATGCPVFTFLSQISAKGVASEVFLLSS